MPSTAIILVLVVILLILWDIYLYTKIKEGKETISMVMFEWGRRHPMIILAIGVLLGHWFWPMEGVC